MKPAPFSYVAPASLQQAAAILAAHAGEARVLAGGQSLIPLMNLRVAAPRLLIDLGRCTELSYIRRDGEALALGAMVRQAEAEHSPLVKELCPLLAATLPYVGHPVIRSRGTVCGSLAHADRVAELPGVAVALGAELVAEGPAGRRIIAADDFFVADLTTALRPDEILREVRFPIAPAHTRSGFLKSGVRHHDLALVGIAAEVTLEGGRIARARLAAVGVGPRPVRLREAEARLTGAAASPHGIAERCSVSGLETGDDAYASARYRMRLTQGLLARVLRSLLADG